MRDLLFNLKLVSVCFGLLFYGQTGLAQKLPTSQRSERAITRNTVNLERELNEKGLESGQPIYLRIFKESKELEVWVKKENRFELFKTYPICYFSGELGPKTKQGDNQSPEGFYFVNSTRFNPWSDFHLSFNLGYPNAYDRLKGYTGDYLMIHGSCVSIGCYAMTDAVIEELYTLAFKAVQNGQLFFRVHCFPFRMTDDALQKQRNSVWFSFWQNLKEGYDLFEVNKVPPNVEVANGRYVFN